MGAYLLRRLLLVVPTLFGIILINFVVVQFAPGGPVEQALAELRGEGAQTLRAVDGRGPRESCASGRRRAAAAGKGRSVPIAVRAGSIPPSSPKSSASSALTSRGTSGC